MTEPANESAKRKWQHAANKVILAQRFVTRVQKSLDPKPPITLEPKVQKQKDKKKDPKSTPKSEKDSTSSPKEEKDSKSTPKSGKDSDSKSKSGKDSDSKSKSGKDTDSTPKSEKDPNSTPKSGKLFGGHKKKSDTTANTTNVGVLLKKPKLSAINQNKNYDDWGNYVGVRNKKTNGKSKKPCCPCPCMCCLCCTKNKDNGDTAPIKPKPTYKTKPLKSKSVSQSRARKSSHDGGLVKRTPLLQRINWKLIQTILLVIILIVLVSLLAMVINTKTKYYQSRNDKNIETRGMHVYQDSKYPYGRTGVIVGFVVLLFMYLLRATTLFNRALASILGSLFALGMVCAISGELLSLEEIVTMINGDALLLMFSMMLFVAILEPSGFFEFISMFALKISNGKPWPLVIYLSLLTIGMSAFLDNFALIVLLVPLVIRVCGAAKIPPQPVIIMTIFSLNFGGMMLAIGNAPNIMLVTDHLFLKRKELDYMSFSVHMFIGSIFVIVVAYLQLRYIYFRKLKNEEPNIEAGDQPPVKPEKIESKDVEENKIKDVGLLIKCGVILAIDTLMYITIAVTVLRSVSYAWIALIGIVLLVIIAGKTNDFGTYITQVDWTTLLHIATLYILIECSNKLGFIDFISDCFAKMIKISDNEHSNLAMAIICLFLFPTILSAFFDNVPVTIIMIKVIHNLHYTDEKLKSLHILPLVISVAFAAGIGGCGTLLGAQTNMIAARLSAKHGYPISFMMFFKTGMLLMLGCMLMASVYVWLWHAVFHWVT